MTEGDAPPQVTRVGAYAVCVDEASRLLLCRVAPGHWVGREGWWMLPGGGLEHGEDPRDGALRELTEETGLTGEVEGLLDVHSWHEISTTVAGHREDHHAIRVLYRCRITVGELRDEVEGSTDTCRWFTRSELPADRLVEVAALAARLVL